MSHVATASKPIFQAGKEFVSANDVCIAGTRGTPYQYPPTMADLEEVWPPINREQNCALQPLSAFRPDAKTFFSSISAAWRRRTRQPTCEFDAATAEEGYAGPLRLPHKPPCHCSE